MNGPYKVFMGPLVVVQVDAENSSLRTAKRIKVKRSEDSVTLALVEGRQRCYTDGWDWVEQPRTTLIATMPLDEFRAFMAKVLEDA